MLRFFTLIVIGAFCLMTMCTYGQTFPGPGKCLTFNGRGTYVNCGTSNRGITRQVTLECWINTTSFNNQWMIGKYSNQFAEEKGYCLATWNGTAILAGRTGNGGYYTSGFSTTRVDDGRWHHIAGVIDNNQWRLYVDGILEGNIQQNYTNADLTNGTPLLIGDYYDQMSRNFTGEIDEVRVWRVARTEAQLRAGMCRKFTLAPPELVAYYRLDENSGATTRDAGSQPVTGILQSFGNAPWHWSGAAIGDRSVFVYNAASWGNAIIKLNTQTNDTIVAFGLSASSRGAQLYVVDAAPNAVVPGNSSIVSYGGLFTAAPNSSYQIGILQQANCIRFYRRQDNTAFIWNLVPLAQQSANISSITDNYRGEYAWASSSLAIPIISGDTLICSGQSVQLTVNAPGATSFSWNTGATGSNLTVNQPGIYTVQVTSSAGCTAFASRQVHRGNLAPNFSLGNDTLICGPIDLELKAPSGPHLIFQWSDGSHGSSLRVRQPGKYILNVSGPCGPTQTDSIEVKNTTSAFYVPNIITPNGDHLNDAFVVSESCSVGAWKLDIYNRWGRQVYSADAYTNDWEAPGLTAGLYYYLLRQPATNESYKGWLEVVR